MLELCHKQESQGKSDVAIRTAQRWAEAQKSIVDATIADYVRKKVRKLIKKQRNGSESKGYKLGAWKQR